MGKPNPFSIFMFEFIAKERAAGREHPKAQWSQIAGQKWIRMSDEEKEHYKRESAKRNAGNQSGASSSGNGAGRSVKYSSQRVSLDEIERNERKRQEEKVFMEQTIKNVVSFALENNELGKAPMFFIMANYFYKLIEEPYDYSPAEIAIGKFTLEDGDLKKFHSLVNQAKCEIGYAWTAKEHSEKTHRLPTPPDALGEEDYDKLYDEILGILGIRRNQFFDKDDKQRPRIYTRQQDVQMIESILKQLAGPINWKEQFDVWEFEHLFYVMKNAVEFDPENPNKMTPYTVTTSLVEKDKFDLAEDISCKHHADDATKHCALSYIYRWYYLLVDHVAERIGIVLKPGKHLPASVLMRNSIDDNMTFH